MVVHRLLLFSIFAGAALTCGCGPENPVDSQGTTSLSFAVSECGLAGRGGEVTGFPDDAVTLSARTLVFSHSLSTYCNAKSENLVTLTYSLKPGDLEVREVFRGGAVRCVCAFPVSGRITGLSPGEYEVRFVYEAIVDGNSLGQELLYRKTITVKG